MPTDFTKERIECLNPNSGGRMNIDKGSYELFSKAIYHTLKKEGAITYTQLVEGVQDYFQKQKIDFDGSIGWYTVTIKNDMQARGEIEVLTEKGKKLHRIKK